MALFKEQSCQPHESPCRRLEYPRLFLMRTEGAEWITGAGKRLARLVRPSSEDDSPSSHETPNASAQWFGIEIVFPPNTSELTIGSYAHVIYLALRRSGLSWSARSSDFAPVLAFIPAASRAVNLRLALQATAPSAAYASIGG